MGCMCGHKVENMYPCSTSYVFASSQLLSRNPMWYISRLETLQQKIRSVDEKTGCSIKPSELLFDKHVRKRF